MIGKEVIDMQDGVNLDNVESLLGNVDVVIVSLRRWEFEYLRDKVDELLVDDRDFIFLGKAVPPTTSDA